MCYVYSEILIHSFFSSSNLNESPIFVSLSIFKPFIIMSTFHIPLHFLLHFISHSNHFVCHFLFFSSFYLLFYLPFHFIFYFPLKYSIPFHFSFHFLCIYLFIIIYPFPSPRLSIPHPFINLFHFQLI